MFFEKETTFELHPFEKAYMFETEKIGLVVEKEGHMLTVYATDIAHENIYCALCLLPPEYFRNRTLRIVEKGDKIFADFVQLKFMIDFENELCACDADDMKLFGSPEWGHDIKLSPWLDEYNDNL